MGAVRVVRLSDQECRIANMFMLPEYQGCGYAKKALKQVERLYPWANVWGLDTIKQEKKLCYLYESMGYKFTGQEEKIKDGMTIVFYQKKMKEIGSLF